MFLTQKQSFREILFQINLTPILARAIYTMAQLKIADFLTDRPKSAEELAELTGTHSFSLYRLMSFLSGFEIFVEDENRCFSLTPIGTYLKTEHSESVRDLILFNTEPWRWDIVQAMTDVVMTGENAYKHIYNKEIYEVFNEQPNLAQSFNRGMQCWSSCLPNAVIRSYDFSDAKRIIDLGGGLGKLLTTILLANPNLNGILFDLPHVIEEAKKHIPGDLFQRCELISGNFLNSVPDGCDLYILSLVLTDWSNEDCINILKNCYDVMAHKGKMIILEPLLGSRNEPTLGKFLDMMLLLETPGRIRDRQEWEFILESANFKLTKVIPTGDLSVDLIEAIRISDL